ncbi:MAG: glycolate oxidase subunit GlcD, partial [Desulfobulbaceae bacterium]|nr:glycolate oxidase subunit GlcD [Desulfobulbaceae bacterium]
GTLGIFTKLILRVIPLPEGRSTFLLRFTTLQGAAAFVSQIMKAGFVPSTMEYMDQTAISVVRHNLTDLLTSDTRALLLIEFDGSLAETREQQDTFTYFLRRQNIAFSRADSPDEATRLWKARRTLSPATFSLKPHKISEDVVVPRSKIPDLVHYCEKLAHELDIIIITFGHAGDGNIHVNIMLDKANPVEHQNGLQARERLFKHVVALQGSISGEHGIGLSKSAYLPLELNTATISLMFKIKKLFDPNNILNPGKIFPPQLDYTKRPIN